MLIGSTDLAADRQACKLLFKLTSRGPSEYACSHCCHLNSRKLSVSLHYAVWYVRHAPLHADHQLRARKSTVATCCWTSRVVRGANTSWASRLAHARKQPLAQVKSSHSQSRTGIWQIERIEKSITYKKILLKGRFEARREALHNLNIARAA